MHGLRKPPIDHNGERARQRLVVAYERTAEQKNIFNRLTRIWTGAHELGLWFWLGLLCSGWLARPLLSLNLTIAALLALTPAIGIISAAQGQSEFPGWEGVIC